MNSETTVNEIEIPRLRCPRCRRVAVLQPSGRRGFRVLHANPDTGVCCATKRYPTREQAVAGWEAHHAYYGELAKLTAQREAAAARQPYIPMCPCGMSSLDCQGACAKRLPGLVSYSPWFALKRWVVMMHYEGVSYCLPVDSLRFTLSEREPPEKRAWRLGYNRPAEVAS